MTEIVKKNYKQQIWHPLLDFDNFSADCIYQ